MSELYEPDFVERNGTWILSVLGVTMTCVSGILAYFLKSRCRSIKCCGVQCERDVLNLERIPNSQLQIELTRRQASLAAIPDPPGQRLVQIKKQPLSER